MASYATAAQVKAYYGMGALIYTLSKPDKVQPVYAPAPIQQSSAPAAAAPGAPIVVGTTPQK